MIDIPEIWGEIISYEGYYQISSKGSVRGLDRHNVFMSSLGNISKRTRKGKMMKVSLTHDGYYSIHLCKDAKVRKFLVHRLVASCFIPNPNNKPSVNHKNGIKTDNRVENLEWCTNQENIIHSYDVLKRPPSSNSKQFGSKHPAAVAILQYDINGNFIKKWGSVIEIQRSLIIHSSNIIACCRGKQKTSGGFIWKHA